MTISPTTGECLTNIQIATRDLQKQFLETPSTQNAANPPAFDKGVPSVQPGEKTAAAAAYGSPSSRLLDITA